jgi:hypothetical protein
LRKYFDTKKPEKETAVWNAALSLTPHRPKDKRIFYLWLGRESMNTNNTAVGNCIVGMGYGTRQFLRRPRTVGLDVY